MQEHGIVALQADGDALADRFPSLRPTTSRSQESPAQPATPIRPDTQRVSRRLPAAQGNHRDGDAGRDSIGPARIVVDGEEREFDAVLVAAGGHTKRVLADAGFRSR